MLSLANIRITKPFGIRFKPRSAIRYRNFWRNLALARNAETSNIVAVLAKAVRMLFLEKKQATNHLASLDG